jgi:hypothetical protein
MKIKTIIILTLIISFNYSVYSEDKKDAIKKYTLYEELRAIVDNFPNTANSIRAIKVELLKLKTEQNNKNAFYVGKTVEEINDVGNAAMNLLVCLSYEAVIYRSNISHPLLIYTHNNSREFFIKKLELDLNFAVRHLKEDRIKIQNTAAVIAINKSLELLYKLQKWVLTNSKPILKVLNLKPLP